MHDRLTERLNCYDDRALSMTEHQHLREQWAAAAAFKPWCGACRRRRKMRRSRSKALAPAIRMIGEETMATLMDGR